MDQQALIPVFISYSQYDRKWRERIASAFKKFEVLDDTLISSSGKDWRDSREELERMWQRARVAILIVTPSFLKDDRMQFEVLQLLALNASDRLRVLSVIGEPWSQQDLTSINFRQIFNGQTFPPGGRSLSQGNEYQIEKDLELLAWEVERLAREVTPASPVESPTATQPQPGLAQQLALSLKIAHPDGFYAAMASLVSPAKAVAPYHVFTESGLQKNGKLNITVEFLGSSPRHTTKATVLAADDVENIVLFQLESG